MRSAFPGSRPRWPTAWPADSKSLPPTGRLRWERNRRLFLKRRGRGAESEVVFTPVDEYTARNRDGVEVSLSREVVSYRREDRHAHFAYEYLILEDVLLVYASAIRAWDAAEGGALISPDERDQILADVGRAFDALGIKYRIET